MKELKAAPNLLYYLVHSPEEFQAGESSNNTLGQFFEKVGQMMTDHSSEETSMLNFLGLQRVNDKVSADCVEAILGACIQSIGVERSFKVLQEFKILPGLPNGCITRMLENKLSSPRIRTNIRDNDVDSFLPNHKDLEEIIQYKFNDRAYLLQALTHPSYPTNRLTGCYQQLEFYGDSVLNFLVTSYIYERCPSMTPGQLTDLRSALVNNVTLACLCVRYNLHPYILSQNAALSEAIGHFVDFQQKNHHEVTDQVELLPSEVERNSKNSLIADYIEVPKVLGDIFEALIGGIFLDSGNDLEKTWKVIYSLMNKELEKFMTEVPIQMVRRLYEWGNGAANPIFDDPVVDGDDVMMSVKFNCKGQILQANGFGKNKEAAKRAAAKAALVSLTLSK